jgi:SpoVK/Ycf46/Vps4 family AAA+-type ATPase
MNTTELMNFVKAGYAYFYIQSSEVNKAVDDVKEIFNTAKNGSSFNLIVWDFEKDLDPASVIESLKSEPPKTVVIAKNWNWFIQDAMGGFDKGIVQHLQNGVLDYSSGEFRKILVIISDQSFSKAIPSEIQKDFVALEYSLPDKEEIIVILAGLLADLKDRPGFVMPSDEEKLKIADSARGLTRRETINAFSYSIVKDKGQIKSSTVSELQAKEVQKTAGLRIGNYKVPELIGYDNLKKFVLATIKSPLSKGIMLVGPAGTGKTHFCKWVGSAVDMKVIELEMAELFGGLVGETEQLVRSALEIISANAPCILFVDEIEKGLAGVGNDQNGDGGTTKRAMAQFLKFLSDSRPEGVYVMATCNNISSLPPEWVRAERWDSAPFMVDLPNEKEAKAILDHYKKSYKVSGDPKSMKGWSGAEIKSVCRIAAMMTSSIDEAEEYIIPVSKTMKNEIDGLRKWAEDRTIPSTTVSKSLNKRSISI